MFAEEIVKLSTIENHELMKRRDSRGYISYAILYKEANLLIVHPKFMLNPFLSE